jgi:hypothetical protein
MDNNNDLSDRSEEQLEKWLRESEARVEEKRRNYAGPHCCLAMQSSVVGDRNTLHYRKRYCEYGVTVPKSTGYILMDYCIFCGKKLPPSLQYDWFDVLEREYGLKFPLKKDKHLIPQEFLTDEWWKNRRLQEVSLFNALPNSKKRVENKQHPYTGPHCCRAMNFALIDDKHVFYYSSQYREYAAGLSKITGCVEVFYCMFCGKQLPKSVRDEWFDILKKEYGLKKPWGEDEPLIPKEFLTDEWWRNRGL